MSPMELALEHGDGVAVFEREWQSGGIHRHRVRVMQVDFSDIGGTAGIYLEVGEPGACACVRRIDLAVLVHALLNAHPGEMNQIESRETCASCGHLHHVDDAEAQR